MRLDFFENLRGRHYETFSEGIAYLPVTVPLPKIVPSISVHRLFWIHDSF